MIDLMSKRIYFFIISLVLIAAGAVGLVVNGLVLDIQFEGGTIFKIQMENDEFDPNEIESVLSSSLGKIVLAQKSTTFNPEDAASSINMLMIKVPSSDTLTGEEVNQVYQILEDEFGIVVSPETSDLNNVAPFIGREMLNNGIKAAIIASLLIILYVWWRFSVMSGLTAAFTAITALLHDAAIMFSVYTILQIPINESFIAAILFILGYSMNDTIVIYDRIRENSGLMRKKPISELVNTSVMQTMSRSINTTATSLVSILVLYIFAAVNNISSLTAFTLPLMIGILSGAYSSIFIASPLWMMLRQSHAKRRAEAKPSKA